MQPTVKTVCVDWLEVNATQPGTMEGNEFQPLHFTQTSEGKEVNDFAVLPEPNQRTRVFSTCHEIYYKGELFATVFSRPYSNAIKKYDAISVKLENYWLYQEYINEFVKFFNTFRLTLIDIKRLDVACDGFNFLKPVDELRKDKCEKVGDADVTLTLRGKKGVNHFLLGSRSSDRYARSYRKRDEIEQHSKKYYIYEFWRNCGVKDSEFENMERLEVVLKCKEVKRLNEGLSPWQIINKLQNADYLQSICKTSFTRLYEFRRKTKPGQNVSRAKRLYQIKWMGVCVALVRAKKETAKKIRALQTTIKTSYQLYLKTGRSYFSNMADELIYNCDLKQWFDKRKPTFDYEYYLTEKRNRPFVALYNEVNRQYISPELTRLEHLRRPIM